MRLVVIDCYANSKIMLSSTKIIMTLVISYHLLYFVTEQRRCEYTGKKLLCVNSNLKYFVEKPQCNIKLVNRSLQTYTTIGILRPHIVVTSLSVSLFISCDHHNSLIIWFSFRLDLFHTINSTQYIERLWWTMKWICAWSLDPRSIRISLNQLFRQPTTAYYRDVRTEYVNINLKEAKLISALISQLIKKIISKILYRPL